MNTKNALNVSAGNLGGADGHVGDPPNGRGRKSSKRPALYPPGSIGANFAKRNYVKYLVERYHHYREADRHFGRTDRLHYAALFESIESKFKAPTYFIPEDRFGELVDFLYHHIDNTLLGRVNRKRGISNCKSFDEYVMQHTEPAVNA